MSDARSRVLAIDVGTSSLKAVLFARDGAILRQATAEYPTQSPAPGLREQDPADWWAALVETCAALAPFEGLAALSFAGTMQNCIPVGPGGTPLGRAVLYSDAALVPDQIAACEARLASGVATRIGNRLDGAMPLVRLMSGDARLPTGPEIRYHFGAKDVLVERLTGRAAVDPTTASTTGLFDLRRGAWAEDLAEAAGLSPDRLPAVLGAETIVGPLLPAAAEALGLPPGLPVVEGAGDAGASTAGAGADAPGRIHVYLGTTGWVAATLPAAGLDLPRPTYTLAAPSGSALITIAPLLQAGSALDWATGLAGATDEDIERADEGPPPALFLPFLAGERSPFQDRDVRAAFLGLDERTAPRDLAYAALEGVCHAVLDNLLALAPSDDAITLIGGVAENPLLRQILADVVDRTVAVAQHPRAATAYGAFRFAARALGWPVPAAASGALVSPRASRRDRAARRFRAYGAATRAAREIAADLLAPVGARESAPSGAAREDR